MARNRKQHEPAPKVYELRHLANGSIEAHQRDCTLHPATAVKDVGRVLHNLTGDAVLELEEVSSEYLDALRANGVAVEPGPCVRDN